MSTTSHVLRVTRVAQSLLLLSTLLAATGCLPVTTHRMTPPDARIAGIAGALERSERVGLLFVPGMGGFSGKDPNKDPEPLLRFMASELGLRKSGPAITVDERTGRELYSTWVFEDEDGRQRVTAHTVPWNFLTFGERDALRASDDLPGRVLINRVTKEGLVNMNLSDVVLYLGKYGAPIRQWVKGSLRHMASSLGEQDELIVVSYSLGSQVLADVVEELRKDGGVEAAALEDPLSKINQFFMVSNQLPLLALHRVDPGRPDAATDGSAELGVFADIRAARRVSTPLQVVAITDPNDLLSYEAPESTRPDVEVVNVTTAVAEWSPLGVIVNPWSAHTWYGRDGRVLRLMTHGVDPD